MARSGLGLGLGFHRPAGIGSLVPPGFDLRPWISEVDDTSAVLSFVCSNTEDVFLLILPDGSPAPTAAYIRANADYVMPADAHVQFDQEALGLSPNTAYDFWVVSSSFNATVKLDVETESLFGSFTDGFNKGFLI